MECFIIMSLRNYDGHMPISVKVSLVATAEELHLAAA